ncbi:MULTISPECIES: hypothetical protein [Rhodomicrobium]|nr:MULTISPECIES: hypothetical protein [Rhodomicrobium]
MQKSKNLKSSRIGDPLWLFRRSQRGEEPGEAYKPLKDLDD